MDSNEIKKYWTSRASSDSSAQSTTQDFYLREIESRVICDALQIVSPTTVADIGCGDARTTIRVAVANPDIAFFGYDYAEPMVANAEKVIIQSRARNVEVAVADVLAPFNRHFDFIYTTRCLINLPSWDMQKAALCNIHASLNEGGCYLMIENFIEGQAAFNEVRHQYGLDPIPIRAHNLFFHRDLLLEHFSKKFKLEQECNISSNYYLVSRIVYTRICLDKGIAPDYFDEHHRYGATLPFCGEYGPVRMLLLRKI